MVGVTCLYRRDEQPSTEDEIPLGMCRRCGFPGPHPDAGACIDALRDRIAYLEFRRYRRRAERPAAALPDSTRHC